MHCKTIIIIIIRFNSHGYDPSMGLAKFTWKMILVGLLRSHSLLTEKVKTLYLYASMLYEGLYNFST